MWIFLNNAFLSIVDKDAPADSVLVRARVKGDIERVFPDAAVSMSPNNDYRFRAVITRAALAQALTDAVKRLDYANFKGSVAERDRHDAYLGVWSVMHKWQGARAAMKQRA